MALHTTLPIHKAAYELMGVVELVILQMPREIKIGIGRKIRDECVEITDLVASANEARDKVPHISQIRSRVRKVETLIRLSWDHQYISHKGYCRATKLTQSIGAQATGWMKKSGPLQHSISQPVA